MDQREPYPTGPSNLRSAECTAKRTADAVQLCFYGTGLQMLGHGLVFLLCGIFIIPMAWGFTNVFRWVVDKTVFGDGGRAVFMGKALLVMGHFIALALLSIVPQIIALGFDDRLSFAMAQVSAFILLPLSSYVYWQILRWSAANIQLEDGRHLEFTGSFGRFLWWSLLVSLAGLTVVFIFWAWTAMFRWLCGNVAVCREEFCEVADEPVFEFRGSAWGLFWRSLVSIPLSVLIIPIPWLAVWLLNWLIGNVWMREERSSFVPARLSAGEGDTANDASYVLP